VLCSALFAAMRAGRILFPEDTCTLLQRIEVFVRLKETIRISEFLAFAHRPVFRRTHCFGKCICLRLQISGWETRAQVLPLEIANLKHWTETDSISEML
jgi:hypothetical protein